MAAPRREPVSLLAKHTRESARVRARQSEFRSEAVQRPQRSGPDRSETSRIGSPARERERAVCVSVNAAFSLITSTIKGRSAVCMVTRGVHEQNGTLAHGRLNPEGCNGGRRSYQTRNNVLVSIPPESEAKARHANDNDQTSEHGILPVLTTCLLTGAPLVDSPAPAGFDRTRLGSPPGEAIGGAHLRGSNRIHPAVRRLLGRWSGCDRQVLPRRGPLIG